ncbi:stalk domain-containing protein [Paenibacillus sp. CN-4]|uniref:stalk domain-containing protein n=1 Tax=Paenibacillus nanchangensis TaxID=3348343 RepID=UPI00397CC8C4
MKKKHWKNVYVFLFALSMLFPVGAQTLHAASKYVELELQWADGRTNRIQTLYKDGVTYGSFYTLGSGASLRWGLEDGNKPVLYGHQKRIVIQKGSTIAEVDGRKVDMGREPLSYISHLYVPIRFLASALDGKVAASDAKTGKVTVTGLHNYTDTFTGGMMGYSYRIQAENGDLEITNVYTGQKTTVPLGLKDIDVNTHNLTLNFEWSPKNLLVVKVEHTDRKTGVYDLYTLLFKNQGLVRKSAAHGLTEPVEILKPDGTIQLIDDKSIRIIEDDSGKVLRVTPR